MNLAPKPAPAPFGTVLGVASGGVAAYSSDYDTADEREYPNRRAFRSYLDGVYMGYKWQCVEFARRWVYVNHGYIFDDVAMAYEIFRLRTLRLADPARGADESLPLRAFRNGARRRPEPGSLLVWDEGGTFETTGHVAVVVEVLDDGVRIAEQNFDHRPWPDGRGWAREIPARVTEDGAYWLRCGFGEAGILGWVMQTDDERFAETFEPPDARLFDVRRGVAADAREPERAWLNVANPDEAAYVDMMGGHKLAAALHNQRSFVVVSETALEELERATNELHALFLHATDFVLKDDALLSKFNIPPAVWPRIQQSWDNRRSQMVTGRFDFALSSRGLKVYEYNCDSASCHMDTGKVQGAWARQFRCVVGRDAGVQLSRELRDAWRASDVAQRRGGGELLHILIDRDLEERYHALYMQETLEAAGVPSKILRGMNDVAWSDDGDVVDADGVAIRWVWKTWAWETALDQLRAECEDDAAAVTLPEPGMQTRRHLRPRLVDVLLRPEVMVYEPLWTLIPSNKAILPVLWELYPDHPYLLSASFNVTDELRGAGYVQKPIVGRRGENISIVDKNQNVVEETEGSFEKTDAIYQQLFPLPKVGSDHVQLCTFSAGGTYAGACVRIDPSPVITADSDIVALRVLDDVAFLADDWPGRVAEPVTYEI